LEVSNKGVIIIADVETDAKEDGDDARHLFRTEKGKERIGTEQQQKD